MVVCHFFAFRRYYNYSDSVTGTFRDMRGTTGLAWEVEDRFFIVWYLYTNMGGLGMGCDRWVTVTIGFGLVSFLTLQEN